MISWFFDPRIKGGSELPFSVFRFKKLSRVKPGRERLHLVQLLEVCPLQGGASRERSGQSNAPEQIRPHSSHSGDICDSQPWLLFRVTTFKAVVKINIDDNWRLNVTIHYLSLNWSLHFVFIRSWTGFKQTLELSFEWSISESPVHPADGTLWIVCMEAVIRRKRATLRTAWLRRFPAGRWWGLGSGDAPGVCLYRVS